jgi:glutathione S-transferase
MTSKEEMGEALGAEGLSLYGYPQCPYCSRVLHAIESLGLEIPLRNTMQDGDHRSAVVEAMGRGTVPVLRIDSSESDGEVEWLPESADIVRYLISRFGSPG